MSLEMPVIASPVGVNKEIVEDGINGFLCTSKEDWKKAFVQLIEDSSLRKNMGKKGRAKIELNYSVQSNTKNFLQLFS